LLVSVRRRCLPQKQLQFVRDHVATGKPVVGIRTASHAFSLRKSDPPSGLVDWKSFDADVFGGSYTNHYGNDETSTVALTDAAAEHEITRGLTSDSFAQGGSLYRTAPVAKGAQVLMTGTVPGKPAEPTAWTFIRKDGGKSFYTSLGHTKDFESQEFTQILAAAVRWSAGRTMDAN